MPPVRPVRKPVITGVRSVPGRLGWVVLEGDPAQIVDVVPQELLVDSRVSKSYGGVLVRRHNYEAFYRATAGRRLRADPAEPRTAPDSDDEASKPGRAPATLQQQDVRTELREVRNGLDELRKTLQTVCESVRQMQMPRVVGPGGVAMTRGPASAVVSCSVAPSSIRPPASLTAAVTTTPGAGRAVSRSPSPAPPPLPDFVDSAPSSAAAAAVE